MEMNPFQFGGLVDKPYFINRSKELSDIKSSLAGGQNLMIYAPRRYGKTSLIKKVAREMESDGHPVIYLDFFKIFSKARFIELYVQAILSKKKGGFEQALRWFKKQVNGLIPTVSLNQEGQPVFGVGYLSGKPVSNDILEILALPAGLFKGKQVVVIFDEFQEIMRLNGESFEKEIRSVIQEQLGVSYVFMGSKSHMMLDLFNQKDRAFYQSSKLYPIGKIPEAEMRQFISQRFDQTGIHVDESIIDLILKWSDNIPYYVQFLAAELYSFCAPSGPVALADLTKVMELILDRQTDFYTGLIEQTSSYQKSVLRALCSDFPEIFSMAVSDQFGLSSPSSTQAAIQALIRLGIIEKLAGDVVFSDPFFKKYLILRYFI
jgi:uncharacterized protein